MLTITKYYDQNYKGIILICGLKDYKALQKLILSQLNKYKYQFQIFRWLAYEYIIEFVHVRFLRKL